MILLDIVLIASIANIPHPINVSIACDMKSISYFCMIVFFYYSDFVADNPDSLVALAILF